MRVDCDNHRHTMAGHVDAATHVHQNYRTPYPITGNLSSLIYYGHIPHLSPVDRYTHMHPNEIYTCNTLTCGLIPVGASRGASSRGLGHFLNGWHTILPLSQERNASHHNACHDTGLSHASAVHDSLKPTSMHVRGAVGGDNVAPHL